jgi:antitoxin PrlF
MPTSTLTSKGQITLPKTIRDRLGVETGDQIDFVANERGDVVVRAVSLDVAALKGLLKRRRRQGVSVEKMNAAILQRHSRKR